MKIKTISALLILLLIFGIYTIFNDNTNAQKTAIDLGVQCQYLEVSKNDCIIAFFDKNWKYKSDSNNFYLYKVLHKKTKENKYIIQLFHKNGIKASDEIYVKNKNNLIQEYFPDKLEADGEIINFYHSNGQILYEIPLFNSDINGALKKYAIDGQLIIEWNYKNGEQDGIRRIYNEDNGSILSESFYQKGKQHGMEKIYRDNGKVLSESFYINGTKNGLEKYFHEDGRLGRETPYVNGKIQGVEKFYGIDGMLTETPFINDKAHGIKKIYSADGNLISQVKYEKGLEVIP